MRAVWSVWSVWSVWTASAHHCEAGDESGLDWGDP
jgi:hypothetical protein